MSLLPKIAIYVCVYVLLLSKLRDFQLSAHSLESIEMKICINTLACNEAVYLTRSFCFVFLCGNQESCSSSKTNLYKSTCRNKETVGLYFPAGTNFQSILSEFTVWNDGNTGFLPILHPSCVIFNGLQYLNSEITDFIFITRSAPRIFSLFQIMNINLSQDNRRYIRKELINRSRICYTCRILRARAYVCVIFRYVSAMRRDKFALTAHVA